MKKINIFRNFIKKLKTKGGEKNEKRGNQGIFLQCVWLE